MLSKKLCYIQAKVTLDESKRIHNVIPDGELSDVIRTLLGMYVSDTNLREKVRIERQNGISTHP